MKKYVIFIIIAIMLLGCSNSNIKEVPEETITPAIIPTDELILKEEMLADIDYLLKSMKNHPIYKDNDDTFTPIYEHVSKIKSNLPEQMNIYEFYYTISSIIAFTDDPHSLAIFNVPDKEYKYWLDFKLVFYEDTMFVSESNDYFDVGDEITMIGSYDYHAMLDVLDSIISNSNEYGLRYQCSRHMKNLFFYQYLGVIDDNGYVKFSIKKPDDTCKVLDIEIKNMLDKEPFKVHELYSSYIDTNNDIGYVDIRKCTVDWEFKEFMEDFYYKVKENNIKKVILDIRYNPGGEKDYINYILQGLDIDGYYNYENKLVTNHFKMDEPCKGVDFYLFVSGGSLSASIVTEAIMKRNNLVTIVGTPPGDTTKGFYGTWAGLPNSNLYYCVSVNDFIITCLDGSNIQPDVFIEPTKEDIINGTDPLLEWVKVQ